MYLDGATALPVPVSAADRPQDILALLGDRNAPARRQPPPFRIEPVEVSGSGGELAAYRRLRRDAFVYEQGLFSGHDLDDRDADPRTRVLVARDPAGTVVGGVRLGPVDNGPDIGWWAGGRLVVAPAARGPHGIGAALVRAACARAEAEGALRFDATVQAGNEILFRRLGWQPVRSTTVAGRPHVLMRWPIGRVAAQAAATKSALGRLLTAFHHPVGEQTAPRSDATGRPAPNRTAPDRTAPDRPGPDRPGPDRPAAGQGGPHELDFSRARAGTASPGDPALGQPAPHQGDSTSHTAGPAAFDQAAPHPLALGGPGFLGDDGAPVPGTDLIAACDAIVPSMVERDPEWAGWCAVLVNINDLAAMGASPLGLLDAVGARDMAHARAILAGLARAAAAYGVPVLGGHTQLGVPAALSVTALGRTSHPVPGGGGRPGHAVRLTADLGGCWRPGYTGRQWDSSTHRRPDELRLMTGAVAAARPAAAKDVSMAGIAGTLGMLAEASGCGAVLDMAAVPRPTGATAGDWLTCFPGYAMLSTAPPGSAQAAPLPAGPATGAVCGELTVGRGVGLRWPDGEVTEAVRGPVTAMGAA